MKAAWARRQLLRAGLGLGAASAPLPLGTGSLLGALATAACAPATGGGAVPGPALYAALARTQAVAVVDTVTDRVRATISLAPLGETMHPGQLAVGPPGNAAVLPLMGGGPRVGLVTGLRAAPGGTTPRPGNSVTARPRHREPNRCAWLRVGTARPAGGLLGGQEVAQGLAADARGQAYVLLGDAGGREPSYAAVVDLPTGAVLRHLPLAAAGERVFALLAHPDGERLYTAVWNWDGLPAGAGIATPWAGTAGVGRLVALDTGTGQVVAQAALPAETAVTDLAIAAAPAGHGGGAAALDGSGLAVYAITGTPGPSYDEDSWWLPDTQFALAALGANRLALIDSWPLDHRPMAVAITTDGAQGYLLNGSGTGAAWSQQLVALDLASGGVARRWPLPAWCFALAASPVGKVYVADAMGDRLWRVDTHTQTFLGAMSLAGAPLALAAGPT